MLSQPLDWILGRRSHIRLLRALWPLEAGVSGRAAGRLAGLSHGALGPLDDLARLGVLIRRETAGQYLYAINREHVLATPLGALIEAERNRAAEVLARLGRLARNAGAVYAGVFGSAARAEAGPGSDLDLLVLVDDARGRERVLEALVADSDRLEREYGLHLSPIVITVESARRQAADAASLVATARTELRRVHGATFEEVLIGAAGP